MEREITVKDIQMIFANPFYAINISPEMCVEHETMVTEEEWIASAVEQIKERGAKQFLEHLLDNLKGKLYLI